MRQQFQQLLQLLQLPPLNHRLTLLGLFAGIQEIKTLTNMNVAKVLNIQMEHNVRFLDGGLNQIKTILTFPAKHPNRPFRQLHR